MKTRYIFCLIGLFFAATMMSCQKEVSREITVPVSVISDSIYLNKIYDLYDNGSGMDTQEIYTLKYDAQKRVISFSDSSLNPGPQFENAYAYSYNGTDTLPFKYVYISGNIPGLSDTTTAFFYYNSAGRKIKDSSEYKSAGFAGSNVRRSVVNYSYSSNRIYGFSVFQSIDPFSPPDFSKDSATLDAAGNIIINKKYLNGPGGYTLNVTSNFIYDNRPHPFARLSNFKTHQQFPNGETLFGEYMGFNNRISQDETIIMPAYHFVGTTVYTYNAITGLPKTATSTFGGSAESLIFTYKGL